MAFAIPSIGGIQLVFLTGPLGGMSVPNSMNGSVIRESVGSGRINIRTRKLPDHERSTKCEQTRRSIIRSDGLQTADLTLIPNHFKQFLGPRLRSFYIAERAGVNKNKMYAKSDRLNVD